MFLGNDDSSDTDGDDMATNAGTSVMMEAAEIIEAFFLENNITEIDEDLVNYIYHHYFNNA